MFTWIQLTANAAFPHRDSARTFRLGGWQFISNGYQYGNVALRDLWRTNDGTTWTQINASTPYEAYSAIGLVGDTIYAFRNDMWKSEDGGVTWTQIGTGLPFVAQTHSPVLLWNGAMTAIVEAAVTGGVSRPAGVWTYDVSANAWTQVGEPPAGHGIPVATTFNDAIWFIGGADFNQANIPPETGYPGYTTFNDVWRSTDGGATWEQVVTDLPCQPRMWPYLSVHEGRLFLTGGYDNLSATKNFRDTFVSSDGITWSKLQVDAQFVERHAHVQFSLGGDLYIVSGNANPNGITMSDVWVLKDPENRLGRF